MGGAELILRLVERPDSTFVDRLEAGSDSSIRRFTFAGSRPLISQLDERLGSIARELLAGESIEVVQVFWGNTHGFILSEFSASYKSIEPVDRWLVVLVIDSWIRKNSGG